MSSPWVVHISTRPPIAAEVWANGWAVVFWETERPPTPVLDGYGDVASDELTDMILAVETLYHRVIGPTNDEFVYTVWGFDTPEEMFRTCGTRLLMTDGLVSDWSYP